jgi:hypothetical protein
MIVDLLWVSRETWPKRRNAKEEPEISCAMFSAKQINPNDEAFFFVFMRLSQHSFRTKRMSKVIREKSAKAIEVMARLSSPYSDVI